ncbi:hypothetical protein TrLO_g15018 [Triparma laevis f. longispina]|uniref:Uncharacterized protein n=1 Tax=Triparma laevis f. longispina TaxID=1714387 RepID=A0A9W7DWM1_9STRA|nr:hypothetical protein TrLO_g15018 [Triparma laevis f. longispina]
MPRTEPTTSLDDSQTLTQSPSPTTGVNSFEISGTDTPKQYVTRSQPYTIKDKSKDKNKVKRDRTTSAGRGAGRVSVGKPTHELTHEPSSIHEKVSNPVISTLTATATAVIGDGVTTVNTTSTTPPTSPPPTITSPPPVTECATIYSLLMLLITIGNTSLYARFASTISSKERDKIYDFWRWILLPLAMTAMTISFALKPRREDFKYKIILHIAKLPDKEISYFLTNDVIMGGMMIGLGQLAFLMFASIQCEKRNEQGAWRQCNRTLISQAGLSFMVMLYVIIRLLVRGFDDETLTHSSSVWFYFGVLATTFQSSLCVAKAVTLDAHYYTLAIISLPIVLLLYTVSFFCQPRKNSQQDMMIMRIHFTSFAFISQLSSAFFAFREGDILWVGVYFVTTGIYSVVFHFALKLRAAVGTLPDEELERFLIDTLFKGGLKVLFSLLFLTTKCAFEKESLTRCFNTSFCGMSISIYLLAWFLTKLVAGGVRSEWRMELNLSIEKIARMRNISLRLLSTEKGRETNRDGEGGRRRRLLGGGGRGLGNGLLQQRANGY